MIVTVWLGATLYRCCGRPFAVGDQVSWRLTVDGGGDLSATLGRHAPGGAIDLPVLGAVAGDRGDDHSDTGVIAGAGDLTVFIGSRSALFPRVGQDEVRVGLLVEDHHVGIPPGVPATTGRVEAVAVVRLALTFDAELRALVPLIGSATAQPVPTAGLSPVERIGGHEFAGYLVTLQVDT